MRICTRCRRRLEETSFYRRKDRPSPSSWCKRCHSNSGKGGQRDPEPPVKRAVGGAEKLAEELVKLYRRWVWEESWRAMTTPEKGLEVLPFERAGPNDHV